MERTKDIKGYKQSEERNGKVSGKKTRAGKAAGQSVEADEPVVIKWCDMCDVVKEDDAD